MGKPTGFMEYDREDIPIRNPKERIKGWEEYHKHPSEEKLKEQGARCMDCGVPFCQTGEEHNGKTMGCPIHNLIPEWNDLVYQN